MRTPLVTLGMLVTLASAAACGGPPSSADSDGGRPADSATDGDSPPDASPVQASGTFVDPACRDGMYSEVPPYRSVSVSDLTFTGDVPSFVDAALMRRYPFGLQLVQGGRLAMNPLSPGDCSVVFANSPSSATALFEQLSTIVHECAHANDWRLSPQPGNTYPIRPSLQYTCSRGNTPERGGDTFERNRIRADSFQPQRPACPDQHSATGCDPYANTYLNGDPNDSTFDSGDQGFSELFEEAVQYVNSLATDYAYVDQIRDFTSVGSRDGVLTLLWYVERYLHMARLSYPAAYARLSGDECWRDAILTVWGRAWLYLELTRGMHTLGIDDAAIEALVADPALLDEIARLRTADGCT